MAPGILASLPVPAHTLNGQNDNNHAPRDIFPDGIKTSGQLEPSYDLLRPYEDFPKHIEGPTVWNQYDFAEKPERWVHRFNIDEIEELGRSSDQFLAQCIPLTGISKVRKTVRWCTSSAHLEKGKFPVATIIETFEYFARGLVER